ncbi:MAG: radical SAM protein [Candidatus Omnitrophica bacterium]|nr:radical SAM protein [Candidatus Omnitrophota bacterium]
MNTSSLQYIYGPVYSWRLGWSLGIDPISRPEKICNFDCVYCQLDSTQRLQIDREVFVPAAAIVAEARAIKDVTIDYLTFSGRGEPTLAANLGEMIAALRGSRPEKIAVITNGGLLGREDVRRDLKGADRVLIKFDAGRRASWQAVDRPHPAQTFAQLLAGIKQFRQAFSGQIAFQLMFIEANKNEAAAMAELLKTLRPDEIQLNTPLRPSGVSPLNEAAMRKIQKQFHFFSCPVRMVYEAQKQEYLPLNDHDTALRHGNFHSKPVKGEKTL